MKILMLPFVFWSMSMVLPAEEIPDHDKLTAQALSKLDQQIAATFSIPFPKNFDIDVHLKKPLALITVDGGKVSATQPHLNPYDGAGTIEWILGPADPNSLSKESVTCMLHLDEDGQCLQIGLMSEPNPWPSEGREGHQLRRRDGELGSEFFIRAMLTYRLRGQKAKDPAQAMRYLAAFEKIVTAINVLRKRQTHPAAPKEGVLGPAHAPGEEK